jgi:CHAT domain-containing protein/tetratricopeptide (TPR) repeat protein
VSRINGAVLLLLLGLGCGRESPRGTDLARSHHQLDSLIARGEAVYLRGAYDSAEQLWTASLARSRSAADTLGEARTLTWLGLVAWRQGDYGRARRLGESALGLKRRLAREADLFKSYNALGLLAWNEGRLADATELFGQAAAAARASGDRKGIAAASGNLALVQTELGEFEEARRGFDSMRVAGRTIPDPRIEGNALTNLGMLAVRVGDAAAAVPLLDSALARYRGASYPTGEQNALGQLGTAYAALGRPRMALAMLDSALQLSRRQGLRQDEASDLEAIAELYRDAGDNRRALDLYRRAEPINRELGLAVEAGADLRSVAELQMEAGALDDARVAGLRALATHRAAEARYEEFTDLLLLADVAARSNREGEAVAFLDSARARARALGARRAVAELALAEARLAARAGRPSDALRALAAGRPALDGLGYGMEEEALRLEARVLAGVGRLDAATAVGRRAVAALERVRGGYESGQLRASYLADRQGTYAELADVLRRLGRTEEAFEVADASRGRTLVEGLAAVSPGSPTAGAAGTTLRRSDELLRTIGALTEQVRENGTGEADSSGGQRARVLTERLASAREEFEELDVRLQEIGSPATTLLGSGKPRASDILARLNEDEALLEYQPVADSLLVFIGRRHAIRVLAIPLPPGGLATRVRLARELIADRRAGAERVRPVMAGLYELLIGPGKRSGALAGARRLVVVPHGALAYLPFAGLIDPQTGRYLMADFALLTMPSAAALSALRTRAGVTVGERPAQVFAPNPSRLPSTRVEAEALAHQLRGSVVRVGREATEGAARLALGGGALVHLAAHAEFNARNPMFSWIEAAAGGAGGPETDGRLEVHEILTLRVQSPLVFLSGCETALGVAEREGFATGEEFATLARAFLYAGARNVVATLWRVDDEGAAAFALEYYRRLATEGPVDALAGAQRAIAARAPFAAPFYWAGYTVAGEGSLGVARVERVSVTGSTRRPATGRNRE